MRLYHASLLFMLGHGSSADSVSPSVWWGSASLQLSLISTWNGAGDQPATRG